MDRISFMNSEMGRFPLGFLASLDFKDMILERDLLAKLEVSRSQASLAVEAEAMSGWISSEQEPRMALNIIWSWQNQAV